MVHNRHPTIMWLLSRLARLLHCQLCCVEFYRTRNCFTSKRYSTRGNNSILRICRRPVLIITVRNLFARIENSPLVCVVPFESITATHTALKPPNHTFLCLSPECPIILKILFYTFSGRVYVHQLVLLCFFTT